MTDTPITDRAELDKSHFSDWGIGPSGYATTSICRSLERMNNEFCEALELAWHGMAWHGALSESKYEELRAEYETMMRYQRAELRMGGK